jgi:hypothetical protein
VRRREDEEHERCEGDESPHVVVRLGWCTIPSRPF